MSTNRPRDIGREGWSGIKRASEKQAPSYENPLMTALDGAWFSKTIKYTNPAFHVAATSAAIELLNFSNKGDLFEEDALFRVVTAFVYAGQTLTVEVGDTDDPNGLMLAKDAKAAAGVYGNLAADKGVDAQAGVPAHTHTVAAHTHVIADHTHVIADHTHVLSGSSAEESGEIGVAQAGGAATITLATTASAVNDYYNDLGISIIGGTGVGQQRVISDYVGASKVATVSVAWDTQPDATSVYEISHVHAEGTLAAANAALAPANTALAPAATALTSAANTVVQKASPKLGTNKKLYATFRSDANLGTGSATLLTAGELKVYFKVARPVDLS